MKINIFAIHDSKAEAYLPPFNLPNTQMAVRTFTDCVNSDDHAFAQHPEDYTLFQLGEFDDSNGKITLMQTKMPIGNGLDFYKPKKASNGEVVTRSELKELLKGYKLSANEE